MSLSSIQMGRSILPTPHLPTDTPRVWSLYNWSATVCDVLCPIEFMCTCICAEEIQEGSCSTWSIQWPLEGRLMHWFLSPCKWSQSWSRVELGAGCSSAWSFSFRAPWSCDWAKGPTALESGSLVTVPKLSRFVREASAAKIKHVLIRNSCNGRSCSCTVSGASPASHRPWASQSWCPLPSHWSPTPFVRYDATGYRLGWPVEQGRTKHNSLY